MTRQRLNLVRVLVAATMIAVSSQCATAIAADPTSQSTGVGAEVIGVYVLPDTPLASVEDFIKNDRHILLGSIGSDLWHRPGDPPNQFWMMTDRGPNGEVEVGKERRRTFPVPEFSPVILHVEVGSDKIKILRTIPLVDSASKPVGGLSNIEGVDETPYDHQGRNRIACDPNGLDTEGLVRTSRGDFWLAEEYSPSLVHCDPDGKILKRYVPAGLRLEEAMYPVAACLPTILARRKENRGFEGLTLSRDGKTLYAVMQSPLSHPDNRTGAASRNVRLLAFDIAQERPVAEYVYRLEPCKAFVPYARKPSDIKVSGLAMLNGAAMLVLERTDEVARLYKIDLSEATCILDGKWDETSTSPSLESLNDLSAAGVTALTKSLVVDLSRLPNMPGKIEGVAVIDARTIAVANDNDFDLGQFDSAGDNRGPGAKSVICVVRLDSPLERP
jgi:hypothetical protein